MSIISLVDQIKNKLFTSAGEGRGTTLDQLNPAQQRTRWICDHTKECCCAETPPDFLCGSEPLRSNADRNGLPPFSLLRYFMGTLISDLSGFRCRRHLCDSAGDAECVDLCVSRVSVRLSSYLCLMQLCKPMQMYSYHLSRLLGRFNPKNDFFYKKLSRFG